MEITQRLLEVINEHTGVDVNIKSRKREVVEMRSLYFNVLKELRPNISLSSIGKSVNLNHATVIHSLNKYEMYERFNSNFKALKRKIILELIENKLFISEENPELIKKLNLKIIELENENEKLKENKEVEYKIIKELTQLLIDTKGTDKHQLLKIRLDALYQMNKIK